MNKLTFICLLLLAFFSCQKENMGDCFKSTGKTTTESRAISDFHVISVDDGINLYIRQAPVASLEVKAGKNLLDLIETKVSGNTLKIRNKNKCNWVRSYKREISIYIAVPNLQEIDYNGSGNIVFQNTVYADRFYINMFNASGSIQAKLVANLVELKVHSGPGDIQASGSANDIVLFNGGNGQVDALQLSSKSGLAVNRSTGKIQVQVSDQLKAEIYESGSILYRGNPSINLKKEGSGMLSPI